MKNINVITLLIILMVGLAFAQEKAPQAVVDLANSEIVRLGTDPVIIAAVKAQNNQNLSLAQIQATDETWQKTNGIDGFMESLMVSECGQLLKQLLDTHAYYAELFVMDNQGANVAMSDKTSDYWQGDEAKFKESFLEGQGGIHISTVKFDDSSQAYIVQVSVPVKDGSKVIGALTVGIDIDQLDY